MNDKEQTDILLTAGKFAMALLTAAVIAWASWLTLTARETDKQVVQIQDLYNKNAELKELIRDQDKTLHTLQDEVARVHGMLARNRIKE